MRALAKRAAALLLGMLLAGCATTSLERAVDSAMPARLELRDVPFHAQDAQQCGPASLAMLLNAAGVPVTPAAVSPAVYLPGREGSLAVELQSATRRFDRMPYLLEPDLAAVLAEVAAGHPVLVMQNLGLASRPVWHFAVVIGYDVAREQVVLRSGRTERLSMSTRRFMRSWDLGDRWSMVVLEPGTLPATATASRYLESAAGLEAAGRHDASTRAYRRAAEEWPAEPHPWLGLGNLAFASGDYDRAIDAYREALARAPRDGAARNNLAQALVEAGCVDEARVQIAQAIEDTRDTPLAAHVAATFADIAARPRDDRCPPRAY